MDAAFSGCTLSEIYRPFHLYRVVDDRFISTYFLRLAYSLGSGYTTVQHTRLIAQAYDSDVITYLGRRLIRMVC